MCNVTNPNDYTEPRLGAVRDTRRRFEVIGGLVATVAAGGALAKWAVAAPRTDLWSSNTFDALVALASVGGVVFLMGVLDLVPQKASLRLLKRTPEFVESQAPPADAASDAAAILRPLLRKVRAELVSHRDEINRVMVRNRTEGLLNVFYAGTNDAREQIAALDTKPLVYPAISDAYDEVIRFAGQIDSSRGGGPIYESDGIERTAVAVYAAIIRIDSWQETH